MEMDYKNTLRLNIHYSFAMAAFWFINAILSVFMVPLLKEQNFNNSQIGILLAVRALSSVFFQPFYSSVADKITERFPLKNIIAIIVIMGMVITGFHALCPLGFPGAVFVFIGYGATINCISAMLDSMSVQFASSGEKINYTLARAIGSLFWAIASMGLGNVIQKSGEYWIALVIQFITLLCLLVIVITMVRPKAVLNRSYTNNAEANEHHSILYILTNHPRYTVLLVSVFLIFLAQNIVMSYLIAKIETVGGGTAELGVAQALLAIVEIFVPLYYFRFRKKLGVTKVVELALLFTVIRIVVISMAPNIYIIYLAQISQALACLYWSGNVEFVHENIEVGDRIKGQGILSAIQTGFAGCVGSVVAGQMLTYVDAGGLYIFSSVCAISGLVVLFGGNLILNMKNSNRNPEEIKM